MLATLFLGHLNWYICSVLLLSSVRNDRGVDLIASFCNKYQTSEDELKKTMEKANNLIVDILKKKPRLASDCKSENLDNINTGWFDYFVVCSYNHHRIIILYFGVTYHIYWGLALWFPHFHSIVFKAMFFIIHKSFLTNLLMVFVCLTVFLVSWTCNPSILCMGVVYGLLNTYPTISCDILWFSCIVPAC